MELLKEIFENDVTVKASEKKEARWEFRKAARALVFDKEENIAILFVSKKNYHKLPGGGIEEGENIEEALKREIIEETGCEVEIRPQEVGITIEYRSSDELLQLSYCYLSDVVGEPGKMAFTEREITNGFRLKWMSIDEAIETLKKDAPSETFEKFMRARDLVFLEKAREILSLS